MTLERDPTMRTGDENALSPVDQAAQGHEVAEWDESFVSESVWQAMNENQRSEAIELREAIAAGPLQDIGVNRDTLRIIMAEIDDKKIFGVAHMGNGIDIGIPHKPHDSKRNYSSVMSAINDELFKIGIEGVVYDTRRGLTNYMYDARVADAQARKEPLPDSKELSDEWVDRWTWTMLTGEPLMNGKVQIRRTFEGKVHQNAYPTDGGRRNFRVCPVALLVN